MTVDVLACIDEQLEGVMIPLNGCIFQINDVFPDTVVVGIVERILLMNFVLNLEICSQTH